MPNPGIAAIQRLVLIRALERVENDACMNRVRAALLPAFEEARYLSTALTQAAARLEER